LGKYCSNLEPKRFVEEYGIQSLVCCFSGGKDSLVATHFVHKELEDIPLEKYVVFVDTTVMIPGTLDFVRKVSAEQGWNLKVLRPDPDFWTLAEKWGSPTMRRRWCCYALKLKPIFLFVRKLKPQRAMVTGLRRGESKRRAQLPQIFYRKKGGRSKKGTWISAWGYSPIIDWTERDVLCYMRRFDLPMPPHYRLGLKETCLCGVFSHVKKMQIVRGRWPEFYRKFIELENRFKTGGKVFYFKGRPYSAKEIWAQKTLDEVTQTGKCRAEIKKSQV